MGEFTWGDLFGSLALLGSLLGWLLSRRSAKAASLAAARAEERAERSADSAERSALAQERLSRLFETYLNHQDRLAVGAAQPGPRRRAILGGAPRPRGARWTLDRDPGGRATLTNLGDTARHVRLRGEATSTFEAPEPLDVLGQGESATVVAVGDWQAGTPTLVVTWEDEDGDQQVWRRVLP